MIIFLAMSNLHEKLSDLYSPTIRPATLREIKEVINKLHKPTEANYPPSPEDILQKVILVENNDRPVKRRIR